jgi:hypothetical protein
MDGKCLETIEGAVVMARLGAEEFVPIQSRRFRWEAFLPKWKAWLQTLILLPFGLSVANFLGASWHFAVNAIFVEGQYLIGVLSIAINLLLPSLFFAFLIHWSRLLIGRQESFTWYPKTRSLWAGVAATVTIAVSFGAVELLTQRLGICGNPAWGNIANTLLCNLDNYNFESKSWFGAWFIIAAYCYQAQNSAMNSIDRRRQVGNYSPRLALPGHDFTSITTTDDDLQSIERPED